jgi:hypothetical protein
VRRYDERILGCDKFTGKQNGDCLIAAQKADLADLNEFVVIINHSNLNRHD